MKDIKTGRLKIIVIDEMSRFIIERHGIEFWKWSTDRKNNLMWSSNSMKNQKIAYHGLQQSQISSFVLSCQIEPGIPLWWCSSLVLKSSL